jgi:penicillin-binding protein 1B
MASRVAPHAAAARLGLLFAVVGLAASFAGAADLEDDLGRSEVRVRSAPYPLAAGRTVHESALPRRLERLGYRRVHEKPGEPGTYFYGYEVFWIYRQAHRWNGTDYPPALIGLKIRREDGRILGAVGEGNQVLALEEGTLWLEPETLSESLGGERADRVLVRVDALPDHVWEAVLAAEDARFFDHAGVDARSIARAALANVKSGEVVQGGSTITQQLVKNRDLTPKRSMGRKASEAVRSLMLEAQYDKREILEAYLNQVYLGHVEGLAIHGVGAAARVYFSTTAERLTLVEATTLAAMIQGPNRLSPVRHPERVRERRDWVLSRLDELGWAEPRAVEEAKRTGLGLSLSSPESDAPIRFLSRVSAEVESDVPKRIEKGRGVVVETTLDPYLQEIAEDTVRKRLQGLRRDYPRLREAPLSAALVSLDARTGEVLSYVGGDPAARRDTFDRARNARRQPGSAVKPFVLLEAFEECGDREPLYPARRVADEPLEMKLPSGEWRPENADRRYEGVVTARRALAGSRNVPMVRIARWCGLAPTARTFERAGLKLPVEPPPSFVLGSVEISPLDLAGAYTVMATSGNRLRPFAVRRVEKPEGRRLSRTRPRRRRVADADTAWLVRDVMRSAVEGGTATLGRIDGLEVAAKTGTSSGLRDSWFAGDAGSLVTVVWVGLDDGGTLGLTGARAAGPIWKAFMESAVAARPELRRRAPSGIVRAWVDPTSGLRVGRGKRAAEEEIFRRGALPRRDRFWRADRAVPVIY